MTRVLMLGPVNHPHVEHLGAAMHERGLEVVVAGNVEPWLPPSTLPVPVIAAPERPRRTAAGIAAHVRWIRRLVADVRPDVVHAHWLCGYAALAAVAGASPLVAMAWGSDVFRASRVQTLANRIAVRRAAAAMADSQSLLDGMVALGARREATVLLNWGIDLTAFAPADRAAVRDRLGLAPGPVVLSPRSLTPVYNPETIVAAFARVARRAPDAQLVLKHMGTDRPAIPGLAEAGRVRVVGHVPYEQMAWYYQAADVCVSIPSSDSSPRSVWEAMACGCPVVLSDLPWVHELIEPGRDALVVPPETEAVAAAIEQILTDPPLATALSRHGRALAEAHRDRATEMDRLAALYRSLADPMPGPAALADEAPVPATDAARS